MGEPQIVQLPEPGILVPRQTRVTMSISAFVKTARHIVETGGKFMPGDTYTLTGTDGKKIVFRLVK